MSGYGNHPHGQQPPAYDQVAWAAAHGQPAYAPVPQRPSRTGLIAALSLLVIALAAALVFVFVQPDRAADADEQAPGSQADTLLTIPHGTLTAENAQQAVEGYFTALSRGDASAAAALLETDLDLALVDNDLYAVVENRPVLEELTVISASEAQVVLSARLTGPEGPSEVEFLVESVDGSIRIVSGPYYEFSLLNRERFTINDTSVVLDGGSDYLLLPGDWQFEYFTYEWLFRVTASGDGIEMEDGALNQNSGSTGTTPVPAPDTGLTEAEMDEVSVQIYTRITTCLDDPQFKPEGCENTLYMADPGIAVTGISRIIEESPNIAFHVDGDELHAELSGGRMRIESHQRLSEDDEWEPADPVYRTDMFDGVRLPIAGRGSGIEVDFSGF